MNSAPVARQQSPVHPGTFGRTEIIWPYGLSVNAAASALGVTKPALSAFLNWRASLSADMALRLKKGFGVSMDTLMRMQSSFDIAEARKREAEIPVPRYAPKDQSLSPQSRLL